MPLQFPRYALQTLNKKNGTLILEPFANDRVEDILNPLGRVFYSVSSVVCVPASLNEETIAQTVKSAGFSKFRWATQTQFNLIFEARPCQIFW
jgi:hypothetical protein